MKNLGITISLILIVVLSSVTNILAQADKATEVRIATNQNLTTPSPKNEKLPLWSGFVGCLVASVFFGSNLLPVKQFSAGDGFYFQFAYCVAVWLVGLVLDLILDNQHFYPLVLVGGVLWTSGNLVTVFCIKTCGLAVGLLIWSTTSLVMGWAGGRFGFFGVKPQIPSTTTKLALNYISVLLAAGSAIFFLFIKSTPTVRAINYSVKNTDESSVELGKIENNANDDGIIEELDFPFLNKFSELAQKVIGCILAATAGIFYGLMFIPDQYIRDHSEKFKHGDELPPNNGLYYINSQYSGILLSSMSYFVLYAALKRNRPSINPSITIPAMVSGLMWGIANIGFIVAISSLTSAVAYPIISVLPGVVTSLWSLFLFREIQGKKNFLLLGAGMLIRILAAVLSGLSA